DSIRAAAAGAGSGFVSPSTQAAQRQGATDTAVRATQPPQDIPGSMVYGALFIGSSCRGAALSINGVRIGTIGGGTMRRTPVVVGEARISVRTLGGARWDTVMTVEAGREYRVGMRPLRCR